MLFVYKKEEQGKKQERTSAELERACYKCILTFYSKKYFHLSVICIITILNYKSCLSSFLDATGKLRSRM